MNAAGQVRDTVPNPSPVIHRIQEIKDEQSRMNECLSILNGRLEFIAPQVPECGADMANAKNQNGPSCGLEESLMGIESRLRMARLMVESILGRLKI